MQNIPDFNRLLHDRNERLKELACINRTTAILKEGKPVPDTLHQVVMLLPAAWQYPDYTVSRLTFGDMVFVTPGFRESEWKMSQEFTTIDGETGSIEVFYTTRFRVEDEGPFLKEERDLIQNIANILTGYINSYKARDFIRPVKRTVDETEITGKKLLQKFIDRYNADRDVFHDLIPFRVREVLLVANLYDAYAIEGEGRFSDFMTGEYYRMNMSSVPRLTGVSGEEETFARLRESHYDLIIMMVGVEKENQMNLCRKIKERYPFIPTFLLLNDANDARFVKKQRKQGVNFDNFFVWTGDPKVFLAMINLLEDRVNADNDTKKGLIRIILLVEDSARYYSTCLPILYNLVLEQTRSLIDDASTDELYKMLKLRARPKILLASDYETAITIFRRYSENLLCVISDMRFPRDGVKNNTAGHDLIAEIRKDLPNIPAVLQSSDPENSKAAFSLRAVFINKNSLNLAQDLKSFIDYYLSFGHFVYRDQQGGQIAVAKSMKEFEEILEKVPEDSLLYHAQRNHFSMWLMARGEVKIAKILSPMTVADFKSIGEMREFLVNLIRRRRQELNRGKVISFEESEFPDETNVISLAGGSLGGKGRGLAFVNTLIYTFEIGRMMPGINIKSPVTAVIGTEEFDLFMDRNHLWGKISEITDHRELQELFIKGSLSYSLEKKLRVLIRKLSAPLAVRSSSLFEDSTTQPFSGVFGTYLLPNNHNDSETRFRQLCDAIKLVFCSVYSDNSRTYFNAINFKIDQEKMAVVIQPVVGRAFENYFYPHISGTAQSFNFYPVSHMKPADGVAVIAVGLGQYVVQGENAFRFSPAYPSIDVVSVQDQVKDSQVKFYAVDLNNQKPDLLAGENAGLTFIDISEAEKHGTLKHSASVLNADNDSLTAGLDSAGPRVINFANILKYEYIPLAPTLKLILQLVEEAIGTAVEVEFAVDLTPDENGKATFYLLQIKPLVGMHAGYSIEEEKLAREDILLLSRKSMGNGLIDNICDIIYAEPENFSSANSIEMAKEIAGFNKKIPGDKPYILIGPGRWGTRDHVLGIPVTWPQISKARVIVEVNIPDVYLDASLGSHFFHNVTSMNVGYFSINQGMDGGVVNWEKLNSMALVEKGKYFSHVKSGQPVTIKMDGKRGMAVIIK